MASLKDHVEIRKRATIAEQAKAEAAVMLRAEETKRDEKAAAKVVEEAKERFAAIVARPVSSLPDDDESLGKAAVAETVAKYRVQKAESALETVLAARAQAEAALKAYTTVDAVAYAREIADLDDIVANFDQRYPDQIQGLFALITSALAVEASARVPKGKSPGPLPELESGKPNSVFLRVELVDANGKALWRGDQFSDSKSDPHAGREQRAK